MSGLRHHGGPDAQGVPPHDFSTNSNACGPCPVALDAVAQADVSRYPDPGYHALRQQLADFHCVATHRILLAGSASEFIFRITALAARRGAQAVSVPPHAYGDYAQAARAHGLTVVAAGEAASLHWACEPSSPLGGPHGLPNWPGADGLQVLDRAYEPLRLNGQPSISAAQLDAVWQLYSPNKALGLTGVRAAYALAPCTDAGAQDAALLEELCPSWPVGAHGVAMLAAWTQRLAQSWLADSLDTLRHWKAQQISLCESLGWECLRGDANFFCARPMPMDTARLTAWLADLRGQGIKLRDASSFGLPGYVRLGVRPPASQAALGKAIASLQYQDPQ